LERRTDRAEQIRTALRTHLVAEPAHWVKATAICLLAENPKEELEEEDLAAAETEAERFLTRMRYEFSEHQGTKVYADELYADIELSREGKTVRLMFAYDDDEKTWDVYPSSGSTPGRQKAHSAYRRFRAA
jgi:hypothetical protein